MKSSARPLKITLVTGGLKLGGSTTFLLYMAQGLRSAKIEFQIISLEKENPMEMDFLKFKKNLIILNQHKFIFEDIIAQAISAIREFSPTHVIACLGPGSLEVLRYIPKSLGKVAMIQSDDPVVFQSIRNYKQHFNGIGAVSLEIIAKLKKDKNLSKKKIGDVRYGVILPATKGIGLQKKLGQKELKILYCGRIVDEQKRVFILPVILKELDARRVNYKLSLVGDGPDLPRLKEKVKPWTLQKRVKFLGKMDQKAVWSTMCHHDVFLLFSGYEGLPLSLLEAMACGLVPIVSDLGKDFRALLKGTGGKLVPPEEPKGYASAIENLIRQPEDLVVWRKRCKERVEKKFNYEAMVQRWIKFLRCVRTSQTEKTAWPDQIDIQPLLSHKGMLFYAPWCRPFRRILKSTHENIKQNS